MDRLEHIGVQAAAAFEGVSERTLTARYRRHRIILMNDPADARRKLIPVSALSSQAYQAFVRDQTLAALDGINRHPQKTLCGEERTDQSITPLLPFALPTKTETTLLDAVPPGISERYDKYIKLWAGIIGDCTNGSWKKQRDQCLEGLAIRNNGDFIRATAKLHGIGPSTIYAKLKVLREINHDPEIPPERKKVEFWSRILPKNRPGRSGHSFFADPENAWMREKLLSLYLTQAKCSVPHAHRLLLAEIEARQRVWGAGHLYQKPTLHQCRTVLGALPSPAVTLAREGEEAYRNKCSPYIKRHPPEESGAVVGTDAKLLDILCRDVGWRVGRIWWVPFADVASERWLAHAFGPTASGDMVMSAAAMMLQEACVPGSVQIDRGKLFQGDRFTGGFFKLSGEKLFEEVEGLWERLGVGLIPAIGRNPQTKPIERLFRSVREFEQAWSTYTGPKPQERPPRLALIEKQIQEFKAGKAPAPAVPTIEQVITGLVWWCKERWNGQHRGQGKYRNGQTPDETWNEKRPAGGHRRLSREEIDYYTADRRFVKIARGGQVNVSIYGQTVEYIAPELFLHQGEDAEVLVSRLAVGQVTVIYPVVGGTESCVAHLKEELPWGSESRAEVKVRLRCINSMKRILKRSIRTIDAAEGVLAEAPFLPTSALLDTMVDHQIINPRQFFGTSAPAPPHPEMSSLEWNETHRRRIVEPREPVTSEGTADAVLALLKETS
jgi:hypothetical protein